jgi:type IV pilus assembly protein PilE
LREENELSKLLLRRKFDSLGFSLVEVLVTMVVISILAAIAVPSYSRHIVRANREAAQGELLQLASLQEKIYLNSNAYTINVTSNYTGQASGGLGKNAGTSNDGNYTITTVSPAGAQSFTLVATPVAGRSQEGDGSLSVDSTGQRLWNAKPW